MEKPVVTDTGITRRDMVTGLAGLIIALGVLLQQLVLHGLSLVTYFQPLASGRIFSFFTSPELIPLYKIIFALALLNEIVMSVGSLVILVFMALRKRYAPNLLVALMAFAGVYNISFIIMSRMLPADLQATVGTNFLTTFLYIIIDVLLVLLFWFDKPFRKIFYR